MARGQRAGRVRRSCSKSSGKGSLRAQTCLIEINAAVQHRCHPAGTSKTEFDRGEAEVDDFPGGMPGDIGVTLSWE